MVANAVPEVRRGLSAVVGAGHVCTDADLRAGYEVDWTGRYRGTCIAVVRPGDTSEVAATLAFCDERGIAVVPQAGNTGLFGGGVPRAESTNGRPAIVLSTRRLATVSDIDRAAMQLTAGAGVTIAEWRNAARAVGVDTPIDFASRDSATIGGAIATNAGGSRVVRFGTMRQQVVGVEAVLADGTLVGSLAGLAKETVGLHWPSVLCGSEGTLAVITAARLRLVPLFDRVSTVSAAMSSIDSAVALLEALRHRVASLDSIEIMFPEAIDQVAAHLRRTAPAELPQGGVAVLIECADHSDPAPALMSAIHSIEGVVATAVASGDAQRQQLLAWRDRVPEAIAAVAATGAGPTYKLDVAVPTRAIGQLVEVARAAAERQGARVVAFGHLAEGNLHLNFLDATQPDDIAEIVLTTAAELGGTISAEHGIGIAKTRWLHLVRSTGDLAAQHALKQALDPNLILNPGVLQPPG